MKRKLLIFIGIVAVIIAGVGYYFSQNRDTSIGIDNSIANEDSKVGTTTLDSERVLVVYFSQGGNTQKLAKEISDQVGGDFRRIEPITPYPDGDELLDYAKTEQDNDERPEIKDIDVDMTKYDTVFIGYPVWWYTYPQIILSFFDNYDLSDKTIVPFVTHGGSGMSGAEEDMQTYLKDKNVTVLEGLPVSRNVIENDQSETVSNWLKELGLK
ncbi:flavodoxin [Longibaculum muris]|uniref:flavodoxin n=1 Tax=Longibaculum muris TaxID=1796628 RepID=UPI00294393C3|nr:flavodoxin [Longibaculum muris]